MTNAGKWLARMLCGAMLLQVNAYSMSKEGDSFKLSGEAGVQVTDNRDSVEEAPESNTDMIVRPRLDAVLNLERLLLDLYYAPSYRWRSEPSIIQNETELFHDLGVDLRVSVTPTVIPRISDHFTYTDDPSITKDGAQLRRDSSFIKNDAELGLTRVLTPNDSADVKLMNSFKRYSEDEVADRSDEDHTGVGLSVTHQLTRDMALIGMGEYKMQEYPVFQKLERGFQSVSAAAGFEKVVNQDLRGGVRVGWENAQYDDDGVDSVSAPFLMIGTDGKYAPFNRIKLRANYSIRESAVYPFSSQELTDLGADLEYELPFHMLVGIALSYQMGVYSQDSAPAAGKSAVNPGLYVKDDEGDRNAFGASASVGYNFGKNTALRLTQMFEDVSSDVDESFTKNTTSLMLSKDF